MIALSAQLLLFLQSHLLLLLLLQTLVLLLLLLLDLPLSVGLLLCGALKVLKRVEVRRILLRIRRVRWVRALRDRRPLSETLDLTIIGITLVFTGGAVIRNLLIFRLIQIVKII